jgi:hypothetical protein
VIDPAPAWTPSPYWFSPGNDGNDESEPPNERSPERVVAPLQLPGKAHGRGRGRKRPTSVTDRLCAVAATVPKARKGPYGGIPVTDETEAATVDYRGVTLNTGSDPATETDADGSASACFQCEYPTCTASKRENIGSVASMKPKKRVAAETLS